MRLNIVFIAVAGSLFLLADQFAVAENSQSILVQDAEGQPVPGAVVFLETATANPLGSPATVVIDQRDKRFVPRVSVIQTGTVVSFPNNDSVSHHVYSFANSNSFELPLYKGETRPSITFENPGLVTLGCNIHDSMLGYILIVDTPYFSTTDKTGIALLSVPDSIFSPQGIRIWSPRLDNTNILSAAKTEMLNTAADSTILALTVNEKLGPDSDSAVSSLNWDEY